MRGLTTAIFSARAAGRAAPSICRSASRMSEDDARRIGEAVKNSGVPIKRWPG